MSSGAAVVVGSSGDGTRWRGEKRDEWEAPPVAAETEGGVEREERALRREDDDDDDDDDDADADVEEDPPRGCWRASRRVLRRWEVEEGGGLAGVAEDVCG